MPKSQDELLKQAIKSVFSWAKKEKLEPSLKPNKDKVTFFKGQVLVAVEIKDGRIKTSYSPPPPIPEVEKAIAEIIGITTDDDFEDEPVDLSGNAETTVDESEEIAQVEPKPPVKPAARVNNTPAKRQKSEAREQWDEYAAKKGETYTISGREELSAFGVSKLMNAAGLCSQVIKTWVDDECAGAVVRVIDPATGSYREDSKILTKTTFLAMKAMDLAVSQEKKRAGFIMSFDDDGRPQLNPNRTLGGTPAPIWMAQQLIRTWNSADGVAVTGAERRAALKMLNKEWRDDDEVATEKAEADAIQEMK